MAVLKKARKDYKSLIGLCDLARCPKFSIIIKALVLIWEIFMFQQFLIYE